MRLKILPRRNIDIPKEDIAELISNFLHNKGALENWILRFQENFANYIGVKHAAAFPSGRIGLQNILKSLTLQENDEIIIPAYTFREIIKSIRSLTLNPVPADIDLNTFNIDPMAIKKRITNRTKAILATHLFGSPCRIDEIKKIASDNSLFVIEDCAHSVGSCFKGEKTGSLGNAAFFSFDTIKLINTYGGGMVTSDDENLINDINKSFINYDGYQKTPYKKILSAALEKKLFPTLVSYPFLYMLSSTYWNKKIYNLYTKSESLSIPCHPYTNFQAHLGINKMKTLEDRIRIRQWQAKDFNQLLNKNFATQKIEEGSLSSYYYFVVLSSSNSFKIRRYLLTKGIDSGIGSEIADDCATLLGYQDCPNAQKAFSQALQLPLHENLLMEDISYIAETLNNY